ncbi:MAG: hypothetical protein Q7S92_06590 [Candidatus Diapherotrites archaeon]|nr:hypothetical protein [Candidatus Diapherotrites archaeon]
MTLIELIQGFLKGIKPIVDASEVIQTTISETVANSAEHAFDRIKKPLEEIMLKIAFVLISVFFIIWGMAQLLDNFVWQYRGLGFVIVGVFFGILVILFLQKKEKD